MKSILFFLLCILLSCSHINFNTKNNQNDITIDSDTIVIDVRTYQEYHWGHVPNAINIPIEELESNLDKLQTYKDENVVTICEKGVRSAKAAKILKGLNFKHVTSFPGGMIRWKELGKPIIGNEIFSRPQRYPGFDFQPKLKDSKTGTPAGLFVYYVYLESEAENSGLEIQDLIIDINNKKITDKFILNHHEYLDFFPQNILHSSLNLKIIRNGNYKNITIPPPNPNNDFSNKILNLKLDKKSSNISSQNVYQMMLSQIDENDYKNLKNAQKQYINLWGVTGLNTPVYLLSEPSEIYWVTDTLVPSQYNKDNAYQILIKNLNIAARELSVDNLSTQKLLENKSELTTSDIFSDFENALNIDKVNTKKAFQDLTQSEVKFIKEHYSLFLNMYKNKNFYLHNYPNYQTILDLYNYYKIAKKIKLINFLNTAAQFSELVSDNNIQRIQKLLRKKQNKNHEKIIDSMNTEFGQIVIGGVGDNIYEGQYAAILDLGGNDIYKFDNHTAPPIIIDLSGNDQYFINNYGEPTFGSKILYDNLGDDTYQGDYFDYSQAFIGTSLLIDYHGNDHYKSKALSQGAGIFGLGILLDIDGNDDYESQTASQGFGGIHGMGILIDQSGNDTYIVKKDENKICPYCNFSQGSGAGIRYLALGGIGILHDNSGDDEYFATGYAQGLGYSGGLGILKDSNGNDHYNGTGEFVQGAGVHKAIGILDDDMGDDFYISSSIKSQSAAWDLGQSLLLDKSGNDNYTSSEKSQSYADFSGFSMLIDLSGLNDFKCYNKIKCFGYSDSHTYISDNKAKSISLFIVRAGQKPAQSDK